jgi:hypothetical protein
MSAQRDLRSTELALEQYHIQLEAGRSREREIQAMLDHDEIVLHNILGTNPRDFQQLMIVASSTLAVNLMPDDEPHSNGWSIQDVRHYHWNIVEGLRTLDAVRDEIATILVRIETVEMDRDRLKRSLGIY